MQFCWNCNSSLITLFLKIYLVLLVLFQMSFDGIEHTNGLLHKIKFYFFMIRCFFLLIHFLVAEDYESPESTSHVLSVPLNLESCSISFFSYLDCLPDHVLCHIAIWADDNAINLSYDKPFDLSQQIVIWSLKYENAIPEILENGILHIDLKRRILMASFLLPPFLNS